MKFKGENSTLSDGVEGMWRTLVQPSGSFKSTEVKNDIFPGAFYTTPSNLHREESQANPSNCFTLFLSEEVSLVYQISARV